MNSERHRGSRKDNFRFLIIGAGRGGTSLLAGLLDYHPQIEVAFEFRARVLLGKGLAHTGSELFQKRASAFIEACKKEASKYPGLLWGNKITTEQLYGLEHHNKYNPDNRIDTLDIFFNQYLMDKQVVFILRDGRNCIHSKVRRKGQPFEKAARWWQYSVECYRFFRTRHTKSICIRFEDLIRNPEEIMMEICRFLKVTYYNEILSGTGNTKIRSEYRQNRFDQSKAIPAALPGHILDMIEDDLRYTGYL
jgi:hypothetical protein